MNAVTPLAVFLAASLAAAHGQPLPPPRAVPDKVIQAREWPQTREQHWKKIQELRVGGKLAEVIPIAENLVAIERELLGKEHPLLGDSLAALAGMYREHGDHQKAGQATLEAALVYATAYGIGNWRVRDALLWGAVDQRAIDFPPEQRAKYRAGWDASARGRQAYDRGDYHAATTKYKASASAFAELLGAESYPALQRLCDLGLAHSNAAEFDLARDTLGRCRTAAERALGQAHPFYATVLNNLAGVVSKTGDTEGGTVLYEEALAINRRALGDRHEAVAVNLGNLGINHHRQGNPVQAEKLLTEAVGIFRERIGPNAAEYASALSSLGNVYQTLGEYSRAESAHREAVTINRARGAAGVADLPAALNNLSTVYHTVGDFGQAAQLMQEAIGLLRKTVGEKHPDYATVLGNLAMMYAQAGWWDRAISTYEQAIAVKRDTVGERHPQYARLVADLGLAYLRASKPTKALPLLTRAAELQKDGARHADYANTQQLLATAAAMQGDSARAERLVVEAMKIRAAAIGTNHPDAAHDHLLLAQVTAALGKVADARQHLARALELEERDVRAGIGFNTEAGMQLRLSFAKQTLDACLAFAASRPDDAAARELALTWVLRRKAAVLDTQCRYRDLQRAAAAHPDVARQSVRVHKAFEAYMAKLTAPTAPADPEVFRAEVNRVRSVFDREQADLHRALDKFSPPATARQEEVTVAAVRKHLPEGSALVEFVEFSPYELAAAGRGEPVWKPRRYLAFVLPRDPAALPQLIDLGEAAPIERNVREFREALSRVPRELRLSDEKTLDDGFRELSAGVMLRVFAPLRKALAGARTVLLAPDGVFNLLPFDALAENGRYLIELYRFRYLATGRDLLRPKSTTATGTTVFAGPDFDWRPEAAPNPVPSAPADQRLALRGVDALQLRGLRWKPLPGATREADDIRQALVGTGFGPVSVVTGAEARKAAFTGSQPPRLLHVATHGFFLPERAGEDADEPTSRAANQPARAGLPPMLRSGLVLTGANRLTDSTVPATGADNGWLTAEEVAQMNLRGTELVVLSACESGLGDLTQAGEGVFGLRRAFLYAGAESLIVSLFKVPDTETRELMRGFYQKLGKGATPADALHEAKVELIEGRRREHKAAHPFFWANFILVGTRG